MNKKIKLKHPSKDIVATYGTELVGKKIVLCIAGSVAAYKSIELARLLMRHGADVSCVVSNAATKLIKPDYFKWATGNNVITKLTGELEHIQLADYKQSDLIVVYPGTANTLGKLANGIDDTPISTVLTVGFGSKIPILIALAMHESMYNNSSVLRNIKFLKRKIDFISPKIIEGKAKAAEPEDVLEFILKKFGFSNKLHNKKVLITAGSTIEYVDPIRVITNTSTGKTGILLATELISAGAKVTLVYGEGKENVPNGAKVIRVQTVNEMLKTVKDQMKKEFDIVILSAAASDYIPIKSKKSKIKSTAKKITINLVQAKKIINEIKKIQKNVFLVGFKAETNISIKKLVTESRKKMKESNADIIIANDVGTKRYKKNPNFNEVFVIDSKSYTSSGWKNKEHIAKFIRKQIEKQF